MNLEWNRVDRNFHGFLPSPGLSYAFRFLEHRINAMVLWNKPFDIERCEYGPFLFVMRILDGGCVSFDQNVIWPGVIWPQRQVPPATPVHSHVTSLMAFSTGFTCRLVAWRLGQMSSPRNCGQVSPWSNYILVRRRAALHRYGLSLLPRVGAHRPKRQTVRDVKSRHAQAR